MRNYGIMKKGKETAMDDEELEEEPEEEQPDEREQYLEYCDELYDDYVNESLLKSSEELARQIWDLQKENAKLKRRVLSYRDRCKRLKDRVEWLSKDFSNQEYRARVQEIDKLREMERERSRRINEKYQKLKAEHEKLKGEHEKLKRRCGIK